MIVKITSKRQVTFPKHVMEKYHLKAGDTLSITETDQGLLIRPNRFTDENLAPLRGLIPDDYPEPDFEAIRHAAAKDPSLRD